MNEEPLYCTVCGAEGGDCEYDPWSPDFVPGRYCETCGVIPAPDKACQFHQEGGRPQPCES
jgi:hypothetical protein